MITGSVSQMAAQPLLNLVGVLFWLFWAPGVFALECDWKYEEGMREIYRQTVWGYGAQVGLSSAGDPDAYPTDWQSADQLFVASSGGIAVATAANDHVEVIVLTGKNELSDEPLVVMPLTVGDDGLSVGVPDGVDRLDWPAGIVRLYVYAFGPRGNPTRVTFVLEPVTCSQ